MNKKSILFLSLCLFIVQKMPAQSSKVSSGKTEQVIDFFDKQHNFLVDLYKHLHQNPELSYQEKETAKLLADQLREIGFLVTENVGGYGVVGVLENGKGPTVMVRTDMDALPIKEETGLPYASTVTVQGSSGQTTPVMHACGHDFHMVTWLGTAKILSELKDQWKGTVVFIAQPAEEQGAGAKTMIEDGLFTRFPRPDYGLAIHVNASLETGKIGYTPGYSLANVDELQIKVKGRGGHGASPHTTIDPIVLASKIVLGLQTIVSRELNPVENPAVISVGSIHGGNKANIIPNEVDLELTLRSFGDQTRKQLIEKIKRTCDGIALSAGLSKEDYPIVTVNDEYTPSVYNNPELSQQMADVFQGLIGLENVVLLNKEMFGEDFSHYTRSEPSIPTLLYSIGTVAPNVLIDPDQKVYSTHSSKYQPVIDPSLKIAVMSMSLGVLKLLEK